MDEKKMIYRVIMRVSYHEALFDFDNIEEAGDFCKALLVHNVDGEDAKRKHSVSMEIIDPTFVENNNEEDEEE